MSTVADTAPGALDLSVVVPLYNEQDNVVALHAAVVEALAPLPMRFELVLVDDGSRDATVACARAVVDRDARVRVVCLRRNYGQTAAMAAGIRAARGRVIATMDGDLQNDPADIPRLLARLDEGYEIVAGWRRKRHDGGARVFLSKVANRIIARAMDAPVRDTGCSLKVFKAALVQGLPLYGDMHRFIPAISRLAGARLSQMEVNHRPRAFGTSKYGFSRVWKVMLDIVSIRFLLRHSRGSLRGSTAAAGGLFAAGLALMAHAVADGADHMIVPGGIGILLLSLGVFVGATGFLGFLHALHDRDESCYALLSATVHARPFPDPEDVSS